MASVSCLPSFPRPQDMTPGLASKSSPHVHTCPGASRGTSLQRSGQFTVLTFARDPVRSTSPTVSFCFVLPTPNRLSRSRAATCHSNAAKSHVQNVIHHEGREAYGDLSPASVSGVCFLQTPCSHAQGRGCPLAQPEECPRALCLRGQLAAASSGGHSFPAATRGAFVSAYDSLGDVSGTR